MKNPCHASGPDRFALTGDQMDCSKTLISNSVALYPWKIAYAEYVKTNYLVKGRNIIKQSLL